MSGWEEWIEGLKRLRHGEVAAELGEVLRLSEIMARGFRDPEVAAAWREEVGGGFRPRLERFQTCQAQPDQIYARWVEPDLLSALDLLARYYSQACQDAQAGHQPAATLARALRRVLFERLDAACQNQDWFAIQPVEPYRTPFDPGQHHALEGRATESARGLVVELRGVGLLDCVERFVQRKTPVVVGR